MEKNWIKVGGKIGGKVLFKELIRSRVNTENDRTKTDIIHLIDIEGGD